MNAKPGLALLVLLCALLFAACDSGDDPARSGAGSGQAGDDDNNDASPGDDDDDDNNDSSPGDDDDDDDSPDDDDDDDDNDSSPGDDDDDDNDNDDDGWDNLSDELGPGEVRAGVITSTDELIGGPRARGALGDYKIYNSRVEFIVRAPENPGVGWAPYSGNLIDADRARPQGEDGVDSLWALEQTVGVLHAFMGKEGSVPTDGHQGAAVVRIVGKDGGIDIEDHMLPTWDYGLTITNDYILAPDADYLTITTTLKNETDRDRYVLIADEPLMNDETRFFTPRAGYELGELDLLSALRWVGGVNRLRLPVSYAVATLDPERKFYAPYSDGDLLPLVDGALHLTPQGEASYERLFIVGAGDTTLIQSALLAYDNDANFGTLHGTLQLAGGDSPSDVEIIVRDTVRPAGANYVGVAWPDESGGFAMQLAPGGYTLTATGEGRFDSSPVAVQIAAGETTEATVAIDPAGTLSFSITDGDGFPLPSKLIFQSGFDAPRAAAVVSRLWTATGQGAEAVLPGEYTVTVARGYEYEIDVQNVTIATGETTELNASLARVVDTTGHMTGDFHVHTEFSIDSQGIAGLRVRDALAEGIELPVFTDHDYVADLAPYVEALGVQAWVQPVRGMEISPSWGHTNAWPLEPPAGAADYFGIRLADYDDNGHCTGKREFADLWDHARNEFGALIVQVNHPRSEALGWFNWVGYDPAVGVDSVDPARWSDAFDAIEVWNSGKNDENLRTLDDWFSFLDQGYTFTMTGNSDSHGSSSALGNPRNIFAMPTDDPGEADPLDMVEAILNHRNEVCNGPFVSFSIQGQPIGSLVTGVTKAAVDLDVVIQAPSWIDVDFVRVYSNGGEIIAELTVTGGGVVRFDDAIPVSSDVDAWFVVEAGHSTGTLSPVAPGELIFTITNPIWVDFDGNQQFDPPGIGGTK